MTEVSLSDILLAREERAGLQSDIIKRFDCPIISYTLNIAGPRKNSSLISRAFTLGIEELDSSIDSEKIIFKHIDAVQSTGPLAIYAINDDPEKLKSICVEIEEKTAIGRLFDMDVIDKSFKKLTRSSERGCIVCGAPGRACAASRAHSVDEIVARMNGIMISELFMHDSDRIAELVHESLIREVKTTPKPGLVDLRNNGSHKDMTVATFEKSADALRDYFSECLTIGRNTFELPHNNTFASLRKAGISAEQRMYEATDGVNTHKGVIFSFGIICGAIGRLWQSEYMIPDVDAILLESGEIAKSAIDIDLTNAQGATPGERMFLSSGKGGIRHEAASGFTTVRDTSLPVFRNLIASGKSLNDAGAITLVHLVANLDDTSIYNRGGIDGLEFAKEYARNLLKNQSIPTIPMIEELDEIFIHKNISAGGSADLLAITYFLYELKKIATS